MMTVDSSKIHGLILDMDGVIWRRYHPIGDLQEIFRRLEDGGWKLVLATNNSTKTPQDYVQTLAEFGVNVESQQIINSSEATASYLSTKYPQGGYVHIIGEEGLHKALKESGFAHVDFNDEEEILAVVVGMDRELDYQKITKASLLIQQGVDFIGTNPDKTFPTPQGFYPGAGTGLAALEAASGVTPTVIGKPQPAMFHVALERLGTKPQETLMIGDRLETDIVGGQRAGCHTALVLTGVSSQEEAATLSPQPDVIAKDLSAVLDIIEK